MKLETTYKEAIKYLNEIKPEILNKEQLEGLFHPSTQCNTKEKVLERLLGTLQNYQSMPGVIGFYAKKERATSFRRILLNYDSDKILNTYKTPNGLLNAFIKEFNVEKNFSWEKYSKATISACHFMNQFKDFKDFNSFVGRFVYNESTAAALPMLLSKEIYGMGFALGCDFLKEIGYEQYPKPDTHLMYIFSELGLCENKQYDCYKAIIRMASVVKEKPFKVDKVFWLIGSNDFGIKNYRKTGSKEDFVNRLKTNYTWFTK